MCHGGLGHCIMYAHGNHCLHEILGIICTTYHNLRHTKLLGHSQLGASLPQFRITAFRALEGVTPVESLSRIEPRNGSSSTAVSHLIFIRLSARHAHLKQKDSSGHYLKFFKACLISTGNFIIHSRFLTDITSRGQTISALNIPHSI